MQVLVLGAGGVGGYLGVRMIEAGVNVRFLVRRQRATTLRSQGLSLESSLGSWRGTPALVVANEIGGFADVVVLSCKAYDLEDALDAIAPAVGPQSIIIPFLNGIRHLDAIIERFGKAAVWGGVAHIGVTTEAPNLIVHLNDLNTFLIGPLRDSCVPAWVPSFAKRLGGRKTALEIRPDIRQDMWDKVVFLATLAGMTCTTRSDISTILSTKHGKASIEQLLAECCAIASAEGFPPNADALRDYRAQLTDPRSRSTASMLRDIRAGRPTEGEHILGDLLDRAATHGVDAPILKLCSTHVAAYEHNRTATRPSAC